MSKKELWFVEGLFNLVGTTFAMCTTKEKAKDAVGILEGEGLKNMLEINHGNALVDDIAVNNVVVNGRLVEL